MHTSFVNSIEFTQPLESFNDMSDAQANTAAVSVDTELVDTTLPTVGRQIESDLSVSDVGSRKHHQDPSNRDE